MDRANKNTLKSNEILIPIRFFNTFYDGSKHPQSGTCDGLEKGANCQYYVYEILKYFGYKMPDFRSSDLWEDTYFTKSVKKLQPFDILMFHKNAESFGAHFALYLGHDRILHLSKEVGYPTIWNFSDFYIHDRYKIFIGAKRPKLRLDSK